MPFHSPKSFVATLALCSALTAFANNDAQAAGFYIQEQSVAGLGSAFSGSTTSIDNASALYYNPAAITNLEGSNVQAGAHILAPHADLTNTGSTENIVLGGGAITGGDGGNPYSPTPVPNGYFSKQLNDRYWVGLGVSAPFGLANEYEHTWFGRYDSIKTELTVIDIQPTVAMKVTDNLSIGGGINLQHADAELTNAVSDAVQGIGILKGDDWTIGYSIGAQYEPIEGTVLGASYRSGISHTLEGKAIVQGTAVNDFSIDGEAALDLPDIATFGVSQDIGDKWTLMGQATWFGWKNFQDITTIAQEAINTTGGGGVINLVAGNQISSVVQNYDDTWAFSVGAEYEHSEDWTFRAGMQFDETPTNDQFRTSRTPDGDRTWLSGGFTHKVSDTIDFDLAGTYIWIDDEEINVTRNNSFSTATATTVSADTEGSVGIIAAGFSFKF